MTSRQTRYLSVILVLCTMVTTSLALPYQTNIAAVAAGFGLAIGGCSTVNTLKKRYLDNPKRVPTGTETSHYNTAITVLATIIAESTYQTLIRKKITLPGPISIAVASAIGIAYVGNKAWEEFEDNLWKNDSTIHHHFEKLPFIKFVLTSANSLCVATLHLKEHMARVATLATYA